jgi:hypothetical protein
MMTSSTLLTALLLLAGVTEVQVVHLPPRGRVNLTLGVKAKVDVERVGTVTRAVVEIEELQPASTAIPGMNAYVVWAVSPEGSFDNLGELLVERNKGTLDATTIFDRLAILISAEPHYLVDRPSLATIYKNEAARSARSVPTTVPVGEYEYSGMPPRVFGVPSLVMQARAAIAIAISAQAEQLAEAELRQARITLDTTEELQRRSSPADIVAASAHETIRRAQRATAVARQSMR